MDTLKLSQTGRYSAVRLADENDLRDMLHTGGNKRYWIEAGFNNEEAFFNLVRRGVELNSNPFNNNCWTWVIDSLREKGIGMVYFVRLLGNNGDGLMGIFSKRNRNSKCATEAIINIADMIFSILDFNRISASVRADNVKGLRFEMSLGFRVEGFKREISSPQYTSNIILEIGLLKNDFYYNKSVKKFLSEFDI